MGEVSSGPTRPPESACLILARQPPVAHLSRPPRAKRWGCPCLRMKSSSAVGINRNCCMRSR
eukprot:8538772-Alexandrium_andersonii.AAC.1